jgi:hypothetical protein
VDRARLMQTRRPKKLYIRKYVFKTLDAPVDNETNNAAYDGDTDP